MQGTEIPAVAKITIQGGLVLHQGHLYVSAGPIQGEVLHLSHDVGSAGHFGRYQILCLITREFWWPCIQADMTCYVNTCTLCNRAKEQTGKLRGLFQPLPTLPGPWHTITMYFIVELCKSGPYSSILVVVDSFMKMAHFIPCSRMPTI